MKPRAIVFDAALTALWESVTELREQIKNGELWGEKTMNALDFQLIVGDLHFQNWEFNIGDMGEGFYLQVQFEAPDLASVGQNAAPEIQRGRKWYVSRHATRGEVIQTAFLAVKTAQEHELREQFTYRGRAIFGPHFDIGTLVAMCDADEFERRAPPESKAQSKPEESLS